MLIGRLLRFFLDHHPISTGHAEILPHQPLFDVRLTFKLKGLRPAPAALSSGSLVSLIS